MNDRLSWSVREERDWETSWSDQGSLHGGSNILEEFAMFAHVVGVCVCVCVCVFGGVEKETNSRQGD